MSLSVGFSRSSNTGFVLGSTSQQSDFTNINTCVNGHAHSHLHSNMPRHTRSNAHPSMAGHTQTHGRQTSSVPNFSMAATQAFLDSPTEDTQHYIGKNTSFSSISTVEPQDFFSQKKPTFKMYLNKFCFSNFANFSTSAFHDIIKLNHGQTASVMIISNYLHS